MIEPGAMRPTHPSMALAAYLERLVRGRRVAVLGDVTLAFGERLVDRGARLVHVYDPNAARVAEVLARTAGQRPRHLTHAVLEGDLGVRDGAFDVVVIPDLTVFSEPTDALRKMRRLVGSTGVAVVASSNAEAPRRLLDKPGSDKLSSTDYYGLYDLVSLQFPVVRMLGQAPFVGYTLADFGASGELEVSVDTSLLDVTEEPEVFIAVASERKISLDPFVVVELALADVRKATGATAAAESTSGAAEVHAKELAAIAVREVEQRAALEEHALRAQKSVARMAELEEKLEKLREVESRAADTHVRAERLTHQIRDLEEELRRQRDRATKLAKQLDDEKKARTKAEVELGLSRGPKEVPGTKERIEQLTQEAQAVRSRAMELEGELAAAEIGLNDLVSERADLRAHVAQLEQRLAQAEAKAPDPSLVEKRDKLEAELERARAEKLEAERRGRADAEALDAMLKERDRFAETNAQLEKRVAELATEREALSAELEALEGRLRERGQRIVALERDLLEGLRVGKELVEELDEARSLGAGAGSATGNGSPSADGGSKAPAATVSSPVAVASAAPEVPNAMTAQLDMLATRAARAEADLEAARWRISQLEHAAIGSERDDIEPAAIAVELEQALLASQQELATLRRAVGPEGNHVVAGVVEQSVLLHQVASQLGGAVG
ncbi:MAG: hypothetical protein IPM54_24505 [Polyangiaceae bacterium]|nr:hypothetical protein [Polyangiaceae bacterium]